MRNLTNLYPVSKTLRFELQPIGKTKENIEKNGILQRDEKRAEDYQKVKNLIDEYHKQFIKDRLWTFELPLEILEEYKELYETPKRDEAAFTEVKDNLRALIASQLKAKGSIYDRIFKKELIREDLIEFLDNEEDKEIVRQFADFTTYFSGFHKNRENMYSAEEKSTAIAYRLIHQNLPKFMDNMKAFALIAKSPVAEHFPDLYSAWEECLNVASIEEMFRLDYFSQTLTQTGIEVYNYIIGKKILEDGTEIKGINEYVNLYNQQQKDKKERLPLLVPLYKQILSDREKLSWLAEEFDSDEKMLNAINELYAHLHDLLMGEENESLHSILLQLKEYDLSQINIANDLSLTAISQQMFGRYDVFTNGMKDILRTITPHKKKETEEDFEERISKILKIQKSISIAELNKLPQPISEDGGKPKLVEDYFMSLGAVDDGVTQKANLFAQIENAHTDALSVLQLTGTGDTLSQNKTAVAKIKTLLDAFKDLQHFIKPLLGSGEENEKDELFYGSFQLFWDELDAVTPLYNKVRNWLTRKPYSTEKIKLNFDNAQLLGGWDVNKEPDCTGILLRKDGLYYLGIMNKKSNRIFDASVTPSDGDCYEKIDYKLLPGANKMLPKVFFSKSRIDEFAPSDAIINSYKRETHKKGANFSLRDCHRLIDFFKQSISKHEDWSKFGFHFSDTSSYEDISGFYREVEQQGYMLSSHPVSSAYIHQMVDEGKLFLFRIWNKDFSEYSKGTPNLHTLYWKMLFDERNLADVVYKLNGQAEVFYRKASIKPENRIIHPANQDIKNKNALNEKATSRFEYDIVKDRRYTVDKFQFHVPLTINFKATGQANVNPVVQEAIRKGEFTHIIGIDRGERHLLYLSLIDLKGRIVKQMTLNEIVNEYNGHSHTTDYHGLLADREGQRTTARRSWDTIENIKELKEGYLSQVIHVITKMMVEYKAIVVLEDLNMGFMRGRQKIERQVYEKFEKMLIEKLNCYIDKQADPTDVGGLLHALQLTNKFESFKKLGKQSGCLFYIPAWNTSKIDPVTGFVNLFDTRYETREKSRLFFSRFDRIAYNQDKDWFEFSFDYDNFTTRAEGCRTHWTLCTQGTRIRNFRNPQKNNQWDDEEVNLTALFKQLFDLYDIDIHGNLMEAIQRQTEAKFYQELMHLMKLTLQMRNSRINSEVDYLLSPVADEKGRFFDSRSGDCVLPDNADANGAYNIARKGLMLIQTIRETPDGEKPSLTITNREWLRFAQEKPYLVD
ncbi:MAG: type V CRISPR-associated protein Cas12a/Cpf1 [Bacteroidaceae bacterium]|nr:type V CRISPR-associated protein Cas12a/Cpf1 [Bacteroidaceae bacterium]